MGDVYSEKILIIGAGTSALIQAKTLLDDGFKAVTIVTSADRVGGVWARGPHGGIYPTLLTNSAWGNFEYSWLDMPKDEGVDGRIKAETVSDYLERFYRVYLEDKLDVRFLQKVVRLQRPPTGNGWSVLTRHVETQKEEESRWDRVILAQGPHSNLSFPEPLEGKTGYRGLLVHSSQVHDELDRQILATKGRIVVIGCGKSAIDLATRYAVEGRDVTITFDQPKFFSPQTAESKADYLIKSRIISTMFPAQTLVSVLDYVVHRTRLGAWYLKRYMAKGDKGRINALGQQPDSPFYSNSPEPIWRGPAGGGGRVSLGPKTFFPLVKEGKIAVRSLVRPVGISSDGNSLLLSDGTNIEAEGGVIIAATGFQSSWDFISLEDRKQLGLEPTEPVKRPGARPPTAGYTTLTNPPAPPSTQAASHVYKGIVPVGAFDRRDLVMNGFAALLGAPYTSEIASHWIADFFAGNPSLRLPRSATDAWQHAEDHAEWLRHRFPLSTQPWSTNTAVPFLNAAHYNDGLVEDLGLKPRGASRGLRYYTGLVESKNLLSLGDERRARSAPAPPTALGRLASTVKQYVRWPRSYRESSGHSKLA